jgi:hypothetical protein
MWAKPQFGVNLRCRWLKEAVAGERAGGHGDVGVACILNLEEEEEGRGRLSRA